MSDAAPATDQQLLAHYSHDRAEDAFAELVRRHVNLVHSAALRQVRSPQLAEEVAQSVFTDLARNAHQLKSDTVLSAWLYQVTRRTAIDVVRREARRQLREQIATEMNAMNATAADWTHIEPLLDEAMSALDETDRAAVLLRYFENKSLREVGATLGTSDDAAQKRVSRAVDRLREFFAKRGVTVGASGLAIVISANAVQAAPVGLAVSISTIAIAGTVGSSATTITILKIMSMTKLKIGIITAVVAAGIAIPSVMFHNEYTKLKTANEALHRHTKRADQLMAEKNELAKQDTQASTPSANSTGPSLELLKLRGEVARLRRESAEAKTPITQDAVAARYKNAQEMARNGDAAGALKEFLWCFDEGMPRVAGYAGVRTSFLLSSIAKLGENYPVALESLRERRDQASQRMLNSENDSSAAMDFAALNRTLKEELNTLSVFDQLPAGDRRRQTLASVAYNQLIEAQRYDDALLGKSYANISAQFELMAKGRPLSANTPNAEIIQKTQHDHLIASTAKSVEALAGAGDLEHARTLAARLLAYDSSPETKALLQQHATRAGQAGLLDGVPNP